jgi:hypothetical protein
LVDFLHAKPADFTATRASQKLKSQNVSHDRWKAATVKPFPQLLDFPDRQNAITRRARIVGLQSGSRARLYDVL